MRIATSQIYQQGVNSMLDRQVDLAKTQLQLATGKRILSPSDDPGAASRVLELNQTINNIKQYQRNSDYADTRLGLQENVLTGVDDLLQRARELSIQSLNDTLSVEDRGAIADEVTELMESMLQLANTRDSNGEYLFAGNKTSTEPFSHDGMGNFTYAGDQGERSVQIGASRKISIGNSGDEIFMQVDDGAGGISDMFSVLYDFSVDLRADAPSSTTITRIDSAIDEALSVRVSVGARMNALDNQKNINETFNLLLQENRSALEDLDFTEAVSRFEQQLLALQASQQSFIKIEGLSLFNYL